MDEFDTAILEQKRQLIRDMLARCTDHQKERFDKFCPGGIDGIKEYHLKNMYWVCKRTVEENDLKEGLEDEMEAEKDHQDELESRR